MPALTVTPIDRIGTAVLSSLEVSAAASQTAANPTGTTYLYVRNGDNSDHTVTVAFAPTATIDGVAPVARAITVAAGATMLLGPFDPVKYNDVNGNLALTWSATTSMKVAALSKGTL